MGATLNYYAVKDEYTVLIDKVKALEQTYNCLSEQFKSRVSTKQWQQKQTVQQALAAQSAMPREANGFTQGGMLPGSFPAASTTNIYNQNNMYRLDDYDSDRKRQQEEAELQR